MELTGVAVGETTKCAIVHIDREVGYLVHFKRNINNLKIHVEKLIAMRNDVQVLINAALNNNELIKEAVQTWLARVEAVCEEVILVNKEAEQINSETGTRLFDINFVILDVHDFMMFASREFTINKVIQALENDAVTLVGIHGMPGVGKTMLIKEVAKHVIKKEIFDEVVMVSVSQNPDLKKIQGDVARVLGMKLEEDDTMLLRATHNPVIWERIELAEVGILNCKVAFTTRDQDVCNLMETHKMIEVAVLSQIDSWSLFRQKAGDVVDLPTHHTVARDILSESKGLPLAIVTLGRALRGKDEIVWANAHRELKKSIFEGMNPVISSIKLSYNYLQGEATKLCFLFCCLFPEDYKIDIDVLLCYVMGEKLLRNVDTLEEARDRLHAEVDKLTSSSSCLLLRDGNKYVRMHDVVRDVAISIASEKSGFIVKAGTTLTEWPSTELDKCKRLSLMTTNIRCNLPSQLKGAHLLTLSLNGNRDLYSIPPDFFAEMKSLLTLDLSYTHIESLPPSLSCLVNLSILYLQNCFYLSNISPVERLKNLMILSIRHSNVVGLPETFGRLANIKSLDLSHTAKLKTISAKSILSMSHLEELYTMNGYREWEMEGIKDVFHHWKGLAKFNILIATTFSSTFDETEYYLKSKLFKRSMCLELPLNSVANWMLMLVEKTNLLYLYKCKGLESVAELDPMGLNNNLKFLHVSECAEMEYLMSTAVKSASRYALRNLEELHLDELKNFLGMCDGTLPQGFLHNLKVLQVLRCDKVISLIPCELLVWLNNLVELRVAGCQGLKKLIDFEVVTLQCSETVEQISTCDTSTISKQSKMRRFPDLPPTFSKLRCLFIGRCDQLKYLLPMRVVRNLLQLQELEIMHCLNMETIIEHDGDDCDAEKDKAILSQMRNLYFKKLPRLCSFGREGLLVEWPSLEVLTVSKCENLKKLPLVVRLLRMGRSKRQVPLAICFTGKFLNIYFNFALFISFFLRALVFCSGEMKATLLMMQQAWNIEIIH
ncbi:hypothetical protein AQUCO_01800036v1 [Aquilegia coerulea]|uniref:NB-ARC domain-containing protein n=1 Tax=Aquilegia coerulea TaxID=218851 RepID=A0A2G5DKD5_AQUCA|nr:hypothetical protein AQUCO_01800036v1 [Aquilegia coerulea]